MSDVTQHLKLTVISPLFIGAGNDAVWSPYTDFIQEGNTVILIDAARLQRALLQKPEAMDAFVRGVRQGIDNNRSTFSLASFIRGELQIDPKELAERTVLVDGVIARNHIRKFITSAGRPFIPGSSLKGAVRTALLLDWLQHTDNGTRVLHILKGTLARKERRELGAFAPEKECFGEIWQDPLKYLAVSDTECLAAKRLAIHEVKRVSILPPRQHQRATRSAIPQWSETLAPETTLRLSIIFRKPGRETGIACLDRQSINRLFNQLNSQTADIINREIAELEDKSLPKELMTLRTFYEKLEKTIPEKGSSTAIVRLGGGKTWFDNSIGLALDNDRFDPDEILFAEFLNMLRLGNNPFPSTRSVVIQNNSPKYPLGWVKLETIQDNRP